MRLSIVVFLITFCMYGCSAINQKVWRQPDDWFGEELFEVIVNETGEFYLKKITGADIELDLDFTPASPE